MGRAGFAALCMTVFVDMVGLTIVLVGLPFRAIDLGASGAAVGALVTCYSLGQFVSAPLLGAVSDRHGRRPVLLTCIAGSAVSALLTGLAPSVATLAAARLFAGACAGSIAIAYACAADATPPDRLPRIMGALGASISAAFVVGPALGAVVSGAGFAASTVAAAVLAVANFAVAAITVPETRPARHREPSGGSGRRASPAVLIAAMSTRTGAMLLLGSLLATLAFTAMESTFSLLAAQRFAMSPREVGIILAAAGVVMVLLQLLGVHRLAQHWGPVAVAAAGAVTMAGSLLLVPLAPVAGLVVALCCLCAGYALVNPTVAALLSTSAEPGTQGRMLGANQSTASLARVVGPLGAGATYDLHHAAPYAVAAVCALAAAALVVAWSRSRRPAMRDSPSSPQVDRLPTEHQHAHNAGGSHNGSTDETEP